MVKYLVAFSLYTLAMVGFFFVAFVVYKKAVATNNENKKAGLRVVDALRLSQRKTLYVVTYNSERFLIAADVESTTFLAKLTPEQSILDGLGGGLGQNMSSDRIEKYLSEAQTEPIEEILIQEGSAKNNVMHNILSELSKKG